VSGAQFLNWVGKPNATGGASEVNFAKVPRDVVEAGAATALSTWSDALVDAVLSQKDWSTKLIPGGWSSRIYTFGNDLNDSRVRAQNLERLVKSITAYSSERTLQEIETASKDLSRRSQSITITRQQIDDAVWCGKVKADAFISGRPVPLKCQN